MVIREKFDHIRLEPPRPFYYPWYRPLRGGIDEDLPPIGETDRILFVPEFDERVLEPNAYIKVWDVPWRWKCWSCYAACGEDRHLFKTIWARREDLGERGGRDRGGWCTPSSFQQDEIREHAKQHEIMWSWVRGLK